MWTLAKNTFLETIRDRVLYVVIFFAIFIMLGSLLLSQISLHQDERIIRDLGLAGISLFSTIITLFVGSKLIYNEIKNKTIMIVLSKPIPRWHIIMGKWMGLAMVILCVVTVLTGILWGLCFIQNIEFSGPFLIAIGANYLEQLLIIAFVIFFSTFAAPILSIFFTLAIYFVGHIGDDLLEYSSITGNALMQKISYTLYFALPNLEYFNLKKYAIYSIDLPIQHIGWIIVYCIAWLCLTLFCSAFIFARREF